MAKTPREDRLEQVEEELRHLRARVDALAGLATLEHAPHHVQIPGRLSAQEIRDAVPRRY